MVGGVLIKYYKMLVLSRFSPRNRVSVANTPQKGNLPCVLGTVTKSVFAFTSKPSNLSDAKNQGLSIYDVRKGQLLGVSARNLMFPNFNLQVAQEG